MTDYRCEMTLEVDGEVRATGFPLRNHESIMRQRKSWFFFYGLASRKSWEIYFTHRSVMQNCKPFRIKEEFPYLIKSQKEQDEQQQFESGAADLYCESINSSGGLVEVVGRRQSEVL
jgi:hypothetical protein